MQLALNHVDPWGDDRADLRAAFNTMAQTGSNNSELMNALIGYLEINRQAEVLGPEAMRRAMES